MKGYWNNPDATAAVMINSGLATYGRYRAP